LAAFEAHERPRSTIAVSQLVRLVHRRWAVDVASGTGKTGFLKAVT
jgi:hypothetical protein